MPDNEMIKLMLKALDAAACFLTKIIDIADVAAASSAKAAPSMPFLENCRGIKN